MTSLTDRSDGLHGEVLTTTKEVREAIKEALKPLKDRIEVIEKDIKLIKNWM